MKNASFPLQHISLDLNPNEWIRSDQFSISCSVSVELVLQTQPTLFPQSPRADHKPLDCSRETNRNGSETQTSERDHAHRIKNNTDNRHLEGSRCDLWRWIRHGATLSSHYQQLHMTGDSFHEHACAETLNSILLSTEDALCVFVPLLTSAVSALVPHRPPVLLQHLMLWNETFYIILLVRFMI